MLFAFFDMESDAGAAARATCLSVSGVLCNREFETLEEFTFRSRLRKSRAPEVDAMLAHGMDIDTIQKEKDSNSQLISKLEKKFKDWASKGAIFVGYNNFNYDNILLNNSLYLNLKWPYVTTKGGGQFDLLPAIRACSVFAPNQLAHELNEKGGRIFKLQAMLKANNIKTKAAHESLEDTRATKNLCALLFKRAPEVFNATIALRRKNDVLEKIKDGIFCWHEAWREAKIHCGAYFGESIFPGWYLLWDLRQDVNDILNIANNRDELAKSISRPGKYIRTLKSNRAPIIMSSKHALMEDVYKNITMKVLEKRYQALKQHRDELSAKVRDIMQEKYDEKKDSDQSAKEPEEKIYSLNPTQDEKKIMDAFNEAETINEKKKII